MILLASASLGAFLADRATKALARRLPAQSVRFARRGFRGVGLRRCTHRLRGPWTAPRALVAAWGAAAASAVALDLLGGPLDTRAMSVGLGIALGGAAGNLLDQIRDGAVLDFLDLGVGGVFNLADVGIVAGASLVLAGAV